MLKDKYIIPSPIGELVMERDNVGTYDYVVTFPNTPHNGETPVASLNMGVLKNRIHLDTIVVNEKYRNLGVGSAILRHIVLVEDAVMFGVSTTDAVSFYSNLRAGVLSTCETCDVKDRCDWTPKGYFCPDYSDYNFYLTPEDCARPSYDDEALLYRMRTGILYELRETLHYPTVCDHVCQSMVWGINMVRETDPSFLHGFDITIHRGVHGETDPECPSMLCMVCGDCDEPIMHTWFTLKHQSLPSSHEGIIFDPTVYQFNPDFWESWNKLSIDYSDLFRHQINLVERYGNAVVHERSMYTENLIVDINGILSREYISWSNTLFDDDIEIGKPMDKQMADIRRFSDDNQQATAIIDSITSLVHEVNELNEHTRGELRMENIIKLGNYATKSDKVLVGKVNTFILNADADEPIKDIAGPIQVIEYYDTDGVTLLYGAYVGDTFVPDIKSVNMAIGYGHDTDGNVVVVYEGDKCKFERLDENGDKAETIDGYIRVEHGTAFVVDSATDRTEVPFDAVLRVEEIASSNNEGITFIPCNIEYRYTNTVKLSQHTSDINSIEDVIEGTEGISFKSHCKLAEISHIVSTALMTHKLDGVEEDIDMYNMGSLALTIYEEWVNSNEPYVTEFTNKWVDARKVVDANKSVSRLTNNQRVVYKADIENLIDSDGKIASTNLTPEDVEKIIDELMDADNSSYNEMISALIMDYVYRRDGGEESKIGSVYSVKYIADVVERYIAKIVGMDGSWLVDWYEDDGLFRIDFSGLVEIADGHVVSGICNKLHEVGINTAEEVDAFRVAMANIYGGEPSDHSLYVQTDTSSDRQVVISDWVY